ncbi:hypothetical protein [Halovenus amylolytica]|uniref:hypothetical protein n=1 Tax=Halovenus amylolytica TaxID=2500550 RepID=UPI003D6AC8F5
MSERLADEYDAIIFDNDGVLVEPTDQDVIVDAVRTAFRSFGVEIDRSVARQTVEDSTVPIERARDHGLDPEALWHYRELTVALAQQTHVLDGGKRVYDDVAALDRLAVPLGVVINTRRSSFCSRITGWITSRRHTEGSRHLRARPTANQNRTTSNGR